MNRYIRGHEKRDFPSLAMITEKGKSLYHAQTLNKLRGVLIFLAKVHSFHSVRNARKHFVGNGVEHVAQNCNGQVVAKYLYRVALLAWYSCYVYHGHVHADVAHILSLVAVNEAVAVAVAEMAVESVGIAYWYGSYHAVMFDFAFATVAHSVTRGHIVHLQYCGLERRYIVDNLVVAWVDAVKAEAKAASVELPIGEVLDASRVVDVAQNLVAESRLQPVAASDEQFILVRAEVVEAVTVRTDKM